MVPLIYLARHGETDWNAEGRLQGQKDIALNARGRAQATGNGEALARLIGRGEAFDFVASPLGRTRETMERLRAAMGLDPAGYRTDPRLLEVNFGDWEGSTYADLRAAGRGREIDARERDKWSFRPPGASAESYADLTERIGGWLAQVDRPMVCVAHGGVIRSLFSLVAGLDGRKAAHVDTPQDRLLRIEGERIEWI